MASRSSSQSNPSRRLYDVFDTRYSFICFLQDYFRRKGIDAFIDEELLRANDISRLVERIEQSKISIIVFSQNYANSSWCLDELAKIIDCNEKFNQVVLPVFYKLPASGVSEQTGKFGAPSVGFEQRIPAGKEAQKPASAIAGNVLPETSPDTEFVEKVAKETFKMVFRITKVPMIFCSLTQSNQVYAVHNYSQVLINYRGEQLRYNFVSHLVDAFERHNNNFFLDNYELKGKDLKNLCVRIEESRIALVIFSTRYTESRWCLDELVEIKELADKGKLEVIPIFYKVEPKDVKGQKGEFGNHFWTLVKKLSSNEYQIEKWKDALECISKKTGLSLRDKSSECDFVKEIVTELRRVMETMGLEEGEYHYELPDFKKSKTRHF